MTRKDYVAFAALIKSHMTGDLEHETSHQNDMKVSGMARDMADLFSRDNPRFDRERFLKACGVQS